MCCISFPGSWAAARNARCWLLSRTSALRARRIGMSVAVLEPPVAPHMFLASRRLGVELRIRPEPSALAQLDRRRGSCSDTLLEPSRAGHLVRTLNFPPARVLVWSHVLGTRAPQVLTKEIASLPTGWC